MLLQASPNGIASGQESTSAENAEFVPVFRSGSYSEKGPKEFMEDEHICVDNLREHVDASKDFPSPGAYYGV